MFNYLDLPRLSIDIATSSNIPLYGDAFNITCTVTYTERLIVVPTVSWVYTNDGSIEEIRISSLTEPSVSVILALDPLNFDHDGLYLCVTEYNITSSTFDSAENSTQYELAVQCKSTVFFIVNVCFLIVVDTPNVSVTGSPTYDGAFALGSTIQLFCRVELDIETDSLILTWTRGNVSLTNDSMYIISSVQSTPDYYYGILTINNISLEDDGDEYTCTSFIQYSYNNTVTSSCCSLSLNVASKLLFCILY